MKSLFLGIIFVILGSSFSSCNTDYKAQDEAAIQQYIKDHNLTAIEAQDGLYYTMDVVGTGEQPAGVYSTVTIHYTGRLLDGTVFDSSEGKAPYTNTLTGVIKGWQYGVPHFKAGGKGKLLIPSHLAYGASGSGLIGPNTPIMFDIELISVQN
ncbi:FKBP-type peptidyl-prolyl cis-trans isomerase [Aureispira anguillae]|uniref:Peptidyl-prolyl cis-trans isomerase n=1 Tax=Aureispira anguillae TaxID=2864201 RepID=A0A916DSJ8_9BACT|nr:FKBP-type peptidyl-prolyl cis-trans isomerase [Aureispira anguillae]BDS11931.1 FKBP-type peptidyl-prolyl cis-trans isomerase [Aureispira anguillae]